MSSDQDLQSIQQVKSLCSQAASALEILKSFSQKKIDRIVAAMAETGFNAAEYLAKEAVKETGFGIVKDKITKNQFATRNVHNFIRDIKSVGIIHESKPYLGNLTNPEDMLMKIQGVFCKKVFTPAKYEGFKTSTNFVVWLTDKELQQHFQCKKMWVELASEKENLLNKIYDLRDILNHEWSIIIINPDGSYNFYRPLIWSKIQGMKNMVKLL